MNNHRIIPIFVPTFIKLYHPTRQKPMTGTYMIRLNNNIEIPQMGVGTWTLRGETATNNVCMALKSGFRHIDTAQMYENEVEVGLGMLRWIVQRGLITIPRCKPNHFAENLEVMQFALANEDMQAIDDLNQNHRSDPRNNPDNFPW